MTEPLDDDRLTTAGLFFETHQALMAILAKRLEDEGDLPIQWFPLLLRLARSPNERLRMADLAAQTGLSPSGLTRAVDRLEHAELVERSSCPEDRRGAFAVLTAAGRARIEHAVPRHLDHLQQHLFDHLSDGEIKQFSRIMRKLRDELHPQAATVSD